MTPKSETTWMAWHPKKKWRPKTGSLTKRGCQLIIDTLLRSPDDLRPVKVRITPIQPKKRGKNAWA